MKNAAFIFLLLSLLVFSCHSETVKPTNIILIMVDDLGSADLGYTGSQDIQSPNIDQLAQEGTIFTQAYAGSAVCAPARSTLMTGQHTGHTPVRGNTGGIALPEEAITIAEVFQANGYTTGGFGKWGLGEIGSSGVPEKQGFDLFYGYYHQIHAHDYFPEYLYQNSQKVNLPGKQNDPDSYTQYLIFDAMKSFIEEHKDQGFFCYAPWTVPHGQFVIPDNDPALALYKDKNWTSERINYAAMVSLLDRQVGELMHLLKTLDIAENTLIVFCSDNGGLKQFTDYKTNGKLKGYKTTLFEGGIRVPMLMHWPGKVPAEATFDFPIYFPDFLPTLANAARLNTELPENLDGKSFWKAIQTQPEEMPDRIMYWEYPQYDWAKRVYDESDFQQALRYKNWKIIRQGTESPWLLFDLNEDPYETENIEAYHPGKVGKFEEWIAKNRTEPMPQTEPERINDKPYR